jgi:hypothetical protein
MASIVGKMMVAALVAGMLALIAAPARSAETASPDDTARFLAGLPPAPDSPLASLTDNPRWAAHARSFNTIFAQEDRATLSKVRAFAAARLGNYHDTLLYMFSGPDFLYATSFFPHASTYVFSGLEPVGDIPQLTSLPNGSVDQTLQNLQVSLYTILNLSFFITKNMQSQLNEGPVFGTLPILYVFLARTGKTIHEASFVSIDAQGNFIAPNEPAAKGQDKRSLGEVTRGVKIVFSEGSGPKQTLYYFSTDLSDDGVRRSGFLAFCAKFGATDSFVKSASYLMHTGGFSKVRNFLLDHSATILQDDSGIPLADFDTRKWHLQPFGRYLGPLSIFPGTGQPRMAELYRTGNAIPLDFGIGYRWKRDESNLLLAERAGPQVADAGVNLSLTTPVDGAAGIAVGSPDTPGWAKVHPKFVASAAKPPVSTQRSMRDALFFLGPRR